MLLILNPLFTTQAILTNDNLHSLLLFHPQHRHKHTYARATHRPKLFPSLSLFRFDFDLYAVTIMLALLLLPALSVCSRPLGAAVVLSSRRIRINCIHAHARSPYTCICVSSFGTTRNIFIFLASPYRFVCLLKFNNYKSAPVKVKVLP